MCPTCGAFPGQMCFNSKGGVVPSYHRGRQYYFRTGSLPEDSEHPPLVPEEELELVLCPRPQVPCWLKCELPLPPNCEFCGVCNDPECTMKHNGPRRVEEQ